MIVRRLARPGRPAPAGTVPASTVPASTAASSASVANPPGLARRFRMSPAADRTDGLPQRRRRRDHGGWLVPAVSHAVRAARVLAPAVTVPVRGLDQLPVSADVTVAHQLARLLPALERVGRDAPGGTAEVHL